MESTRYQAAEAAGNEHLVSTKALDTTVVSFTLFFRENYSHLVRCLALSGANDNQEDLAQDAFAVVLTHWNTAMASPSPAGYLYRCAFRILAKDFRKRKLRDPKLIEFDSIVNANVGFEEIFCELDELEAIVAKLPPRARAVVTARFYVGMNTDEIADALNITQSTVRKHISNARAIMRQAN